MEQLNAAIFFDFRHGYGTEQLAVDLRDHVIGTCRGNNTIVNNLIKSCLNMRAPLSFFKQFIVEQNGDRKDRLDIKRRGLAPFVDFARVMSLKYGIRQTNTWVRLRRLRSKMQMPDNLYDEMVDAYELQMQLRVINQLEQIESGREPDDFIFPDQLTDLEKRMLKDGFSVIDYMQQVLKKEMEEH